MKPILPHADRFGKSSFFDGRKKLVRALQRKVQEGAITADPAQLAASEWPLDRIGSFLLAELPTSQIALSEYVLRIEHELDRVANESEKSLMPLYYAQRSLIAFLDRRPALRGQLAEHKSVFVAIQILLDGRRDLDRGGQVRRQLQLLLPNTTAAPPGADSAPPQTFPQAALAVFAAVVPRKLWPLILVIVVLGSVTLTIWNALPPATKDRIFGNPPATHTWVVTPTLTPRGASSTC